MLSHALRAKVQNGTIPTNSDPNFKQVSLLLHGDGTNGAQNNTFIAANNPAQYYGSFNGSTQYLTAPSSTAFSVGTGDFTVEAWIYYINSASYNYIFQIGASSAQSIHIRFPDGGFGEKIQCGIKDNSVSTEWSCALTKTDFNQKWMHVAFTRSSGVCRFFVNGQLQNINNGANPTTYPYTSFTDTTSITDTQLTVGASYGGANKFKGNISNIRYLKGTALYTANFTPPNGTLLAVTGTQLLTLQNSTIVDNSTNNFTITNNGTVAMTDQYPVVTRNGNTTQGTNTPFSQAAGAWSNYFDGTGDYLNIADNANLELPTQDFTIECFAYFNAFPAISTISVLCQKGLSTNSTFEYQLSVVNIGNSTFLRAAYSTDGATVVPRTTGTILALNTWYHFAITRVGTTVTFWLNGVNIGTDTWATTGFTGTGSFAVGANSTPINLVNGYISNLRILKGTALYTTAFTPPTTPLTAVTNTQLLTCQSNNFKDNSSNNFTITRNGDTSVQPFSPFAPTAAYSTSVNGGSMYFDGASDYLTTPGGSTFNLYTGDFTIEYWIYKTADKTCTHISYGEFIWRLQGNSNGTIDVVFGTSQITSNVAVPLNAWSHVALVRNGSTTTLYINGVSAGTSANAPLNSQQTTIWIGTNPAAIGTWDYAGYMSNVRIVKGTAVYTTTFTPPTAPLTAITNTQLLLSGTNAGIFDNAAKNDLETIGNTQVSTSVTKFGTGSMYLDGTGDYLTVPSNRGLVFEGDFTVEYWVYPTSPNPDGLNGSVLSLTIGSYQNGIFLRVPTAGSNDSYYVNNNQSTVALQSYFPVNTWTHLAIVRSGTSVKLYANGVNISAVDKTVSGVINSTAGITTIGYESASATTSYGYIDDFRITKGVARYTANFTPPTAAFPNS